MFIFQITKRINEFDGKYRSVLLVDMTFVSNSIFVLTFSKLVISQYVHVGHLIPSFLHQLPHFLVILQSGLRLSGS